jgi:hypothetical protein
MTNGDQHPASARDRTLEFHMTATYISTRWVAHPAAIIVDACNKKINALI